MNVTSEIAVIEKAATQHICHHSSLSRNIDAYSVRVM